MRLKMAPQIYHRFYILGLLVACAIQSLAAYDASQSTEKLFILSEVWTPKICEENPSWAGCSKAHNHHRLHFITNGFWPINPDGSLKTDCAGAPEFSLRKVRNRDYIRTVMAWPNLKHEVSAGERYHGELWKSNWDKYGKCSGLTQYDYMTAALAAHTNSPHENVRQLHREDFSITEALHVAGGPSFATLICRDNDIAELRTCWALGEGEAQPRQIQCPSSEMLQQRCPTTQLRLPSPRTPRSSPQVLSARNNP